MCSNSVAFDFLKQVGQNILSGTDLTRVALPIHFFEARSFLERLADGFSFAPTFLSKAARKYFLCFFPSTQFFSAYCYCAFTVLHQQWPTHTHVYPLTLYLCMCSVHRSTGEIEKCCGLHCCGLASHCDTEEAIQPNPR